MDAGRRGKPVSLVCGPCGCRHCGDISCCCCAQPPCSPAGRPGVGDGGRGVRICRQGLAWHVGGCVWRSPGPPPAGTGSSQTSPREVDCVQMLGAPCTGRDKGSLASQVDSWPTGTPKEREQSRWPGRSVVSLGNRALRAASSPRAAAGGRGLVPQVIEDCTLAGHRWASGPAPSGLAE